MITQSRVLAVVVVVILAVAGAFYFRGLGGNEPPAVCQEGHVHASEARGPSAATVLDKASPQRTEVPTQSDAGGTRTDVDTASGSISFSPEDREAAKARLGHLEQFHEKATSASPRMQSVYFKQVLNISIGAIQDEFGLYVEDGPMPGRDSQGVPLQFTLNNRAYYFTDDTFPEMAEYKRLKATGQFAEAGVPGTLQETILERYEEARGYLKARAEL